MLNRLLLVSAVILSACKSGGKKESGSSTPTGPATNNQASEDTKTGSESDNAEKYKIITIKKLAAVGDGLFVLGTGSSEKSQTKVGLFKSTDHGQNYVLVHESKYGNFANAVGDVASFDGKLLVISTDLDGWYRQFGDEVQELSKIPDPRTIRILKNYILLKEGDKQFLSSDLGATFGDAPSADEILFADSKSVALGASDIIYSEDEGRTWTTQKLLHKSKSVSVYPAGDAIFGFIRQGTGRSRVYSTSDFGKSWTLTVMDSKYCFQKIADKLYRATENTLEISSDQGKTWKIHKFPAIQGEGLYCNIVINGRAIYLYPELPVVQIPTMKPLAFSLNDGAEWQIIEGNEAKKIDVTVTTVESEELKEDDEVDDSSANTSFKIEKAVPQIFGLIDYKIKKITLNFSSELDGSTVSRNTVMLKCAKHTGKGDGLASYAINSADRTIDLAIEKLPSSDQCMIQIVGLKSKSGKEFLEPPLEFQTTVNDDLIPKGVAVTTGGKVNALSWQPVSGAIGYTVQWKFSDGNAVHFVRDLSQTCYVHSSSDADFEVGSSYAYRVAAIDEFGQGPFSAEVTVKNVGSGDAAACP